MLIFGNPSLYDISALSKLGQCSTTPSTDAGTIFIEVCLNFSLTQGACNEVPPALPPTGQRTGYVLSSAGASDLLWTLTLQVHAVW